MKLPLFTFILTLGSSLLAADIPRALPPGELPRDARLEPLKDYDGYFPFTPPESREVWAKRAEELRTQIRVALGVWPEPTRTPLNTVVRDRIEQDDYTVEKVYFPEVHAGVFRHRLALSAARTPGAASGGALSARPLERRARFLLRTDIAEMKKELESGGERFPESGRSMFQSLGVQLARMGIVAFVYDMQGNSDAQQISFEVAHRFAKQRPEMNTTENWGLYSPQAEAHTRKASPACTPGIRSASSTSLTSLPDVDPARMGCTGASGGGTRRRCCSGRSIRASRLSARR